MSRAPDLQHKVRGWNGLNYDYLKLRKEEVIYKGLVYTNTRVLPLYTAYSSHASARDHVTQNARTVTFKVNKIEEYYKKLYINAFLFE